jgi:hypothetical protein
MISGCRFRNRLLPEQGDRDEALNTLNYPKLLDAGISVSMKVTVGWIFLNCQPIQLVADALLDRQHINRVLAYAKLARYSRRIGCNDRRVQKTPWFWRCFSQIRKVLPRA